jgi:thiol-disulfide isomerase/thioredoxin
MIGALVSLSTAAAIAVSGVGPPCAGPEPPCAHLHPAPQAVALTPDQIDLRPATASALLDLIDQSRAEVVLVNMWATWCMPCREEFPDIVRLYREYAPRGLEVVFVSGDLEADVPQVLEFLAEQGVDFPSYLKVGRDMEFIDTFHFGWSGLLPASFVFDADGSLRHFWEGEASYDVFESRVLEVLESFPDHNPTNREEMP